MYSTTPPTISSSRMVRKIHLSFPPRLRAVAGAGAEPGAAGAADAGTFGCPETVGAAPVGEVGGVRSGGVGVGSVVILGIVAPVTPFWQWAAFDTDCGSCNDARAPADSFGADEKIPFRARR